MAEDKKECKIVNIQDWRKDQDVKERQRILKKILERGNPLDKKNGDDSNGFKPVA